MEGTKVDENEMYFWSQTHGNTSTKMILGQKVDQFGRGILPLHCPTLTVFQEQLPIMLITYMDG